MKGQTNHMLLERRIPQTLRNNTTDAETRLWQRLRGRQLAGCKFRRQHPYLDYVLDFVCLEKQLIVEVDGGQHFESERDKIRDRRLQDAGFKILRFWNNEVLEDTGAVVEAIWGALEPHPHGGETHPHPGPPLEGEGVLGGCCSGLEGEGVLGGCCSGLEGEGVLGGCCSGT